MPLLVDPAPIYGHSDLLRETLHVFVSVIEKGRTGDHNGVSRSGETKLLVVGCLNLLGVGSKAVLKVHGSVAKADLCIVSVFDLDKEACPAHTRHRSRSADDETWRRRRGDKVLQDKAYGPLAKLAS